MGYDRNELVTIGERFTPDSLLQWSGQLVQNARHDTDRLKARGITEQTLREIEWAREEVKKRNSAAEKMLADVSPLASTRRSAIETAVEWREEVKGLAKAVFDSNPEVQACFRIGVRTSRSLPKLSWEIDCLTRTLKEHLTALRGVGVNEALITRGEEIKQRLREAMRRQVEEQAQTPASVTELNQAQGTLYTRARFLQRVAQVEFHEEPERLGQYSYETLRSPEVPRTTRPVRAAGELARRS
jgi:hypothetical protein